MDLGESYSTTQKLRLFAGYAGWSAGQLDQEMARHDWLIHPATVDLVFEPDPQLWQEILRQKGRTRRCWPIPPKTCPGIENCESAMEAPPSARAACCRSSNCRIPVFPGPAWRPIAPRCRRLPHLCLEFDEFPGPVHTRFMSTDAATSSL